MYSKLQMPAGEREPGACGLAPATQSSLLLFPEVYLPLPNQTLHITLVRGL